ncbi:MAG: alanine--tRNA ligase-related protein, partial [Bacteroidales bacterium]
KEEEQAFLRTLAQGIRKFDQHLLQAGNSKTIDGAFAFELFDTFGFPIDLTQLIAREKGYSVDMVGFATGLEEQKNRSRSAATVETGDWIELPGATVSDGFVGYNSLEADVRIIKYRKVVAKKKTNFEVVLNRTPFYAESGGQVGDVGVLISETETIRVVDTKKENNLTVHYLNNLPKNPEADFKAVVDAETRQLTANNHSATHLMHAALRQVLGLHVEQKGSMVDAERFRFDFAHFSKMTNDEILQVEQIVNRKIRENVQGDIRQDIPISQALEMGAMALFGEKYGDTVRVVTFDPKYSVELCGGTHTSATGNIGFFKIVSESGIAAGVRRIEAVTGPQAEKYVNDQLETLHLIGNQFKNQPNTVLAVTQILEKNASLQKEIDTLQKEKAGQLAERLFAEGVETGTSRFIAGKLQMDVNQAKLLAQKLRTMNTNVVVVLAALQEDKINLVIAASDELVKDAGFNAGTVIKQVASFIKGGGGGQPHMATAGGKEINGFEAVISEVKKLLT